MQSSQAPYLVLKLPPPVSSEYSKITPRAHTSHVLAISSSDKGCERHRNNNMNLDFAFTERSSHSLLCLIKQKNSLIATVRSYTTRKCMGVCEYIYASPTSLVWGTCPRVLVSKLGSLREPAEAGAELATACARGISDSDRQASFKLFDLNNNLSPL